MQLQRHMTRTAFSMMKRTLRRTARSSQRSMIQSSFAPAISTRDTRIIFYSSGTIFSACLGIISTFSIMSAPSNSSSSTPFQTCIGQRSGPTSSTNGLNISKRLAHTPHHHTHTITHTITLSALPGNIVLYLGPSFHSVIFSLPTPLCVCVPFWLNPSLHFRPHQHDHEFCLLSQQFSDVAASAG